MNKTKKQLEEENKRLRTLLKELSKDYLFLLDVQDGLNDKRYYIKN